MLTAWFGAAAADGFAGLVLAGPPRGRGIYAPPVLGTAAFILLTALGAALVR